MAKAVGQSLWLKGLRNILVVGVLVFEFRHLISDRYLVVGNFGSSDILAFLMFSVLGIRVLGIGYRVVGIFILSNTLDARWVGGFV